MRFHLLEPPITLPVAKMIREYTKSFKKIRKANKPVFITVNGEPTLVTIGIKQYKNLLNYIRALEEKDTQKAIEISEKEQKDGTLKELNSLRDLA